MRSPQRRGSPISLARRQQWLNNFPGYRHVINDQDIQNWIGRFDGAHQDIAARLLDSVEYITPDGIDAAYRNLLAGIPGWNINPAVRNGIWKFAAFTSSPGESGDRMLHQFRNANDLAGQQYNNLFAYRSELASLGENDTVVFIDDFSGSGSQVTDYWPTLDLVLANRPKTYLMLIAATTRARDKIAGETELILHTGSIFDETDDIFSSSCTCFTKTEKNIVLTYCQKASSTEPKGRGACGLIVVLAHKAPNNSIAVLHKNNNRWVGLFRRYN